MPNAHNEMDQTYHGPQHLLKKIDLGTKEATLHIRCTFDALDPLPEIMILAPEIIRSCSLEMLLLVRRATLSSQSP